jgi:hypothetical protein
MTLLLRSLASTKQWLKFGETPEPPTEAIDPPLWALRECTPSERDGDGLSVFEVDNEDQARIIAGAFSFGNEKLESGRVVFAVADKDEMLNEGLAITEEPGRLRHLFADPRHRLVRVPDLRTAMRVTWHFLNGGLFSFEGKDAAEATRQAARRDQLVFTSLSKQNFVTNWQGKNLIRFVDDGIVAVKGIPATR